MSLTTLFLACIGLFIAGTLSFTYLKGAVVPCGEGAGCAIVDASPYSRLFGQPVAFFGFAGYVLLLVLSLASLKTRWSRVAVRAGFAGSLIGTLASTVLIYLSLVVIKATCLWCMASAVTMTLLLLASTLRLSSEGPGTRPAIQGALALVGAGVALWGATFVESQSARNFINLSALQSARVEELAPPSAPSTGDPNGPIVLVEFADFACPACRDVHGRLNKLLNHQAGLRLVYRHFPQSHIHGHEASEYGAACAVLAGEKGRFWEYADKAFASPAHPLEKDYAAILRGMGIDTKALGDRNGDAWKTVAADETLAKRMGMRVTPVFVIFAPGLRPLASTNVDLADVLGRPEVIRHLHPR